MVKKKVILLMVGIFIIITSCNNQGTQSPINTDGVTIPLEKMNKSFILEDLPVLDNSHKNGEFLALVLRNLTDSGIVFPKDYGLSILMLQDQTWEPVQNNFHYAESENILRSGKLDPGGLEFALNPYIPNLREAVKIRIISIGRFENSNDIVGAYLDITLLP